MHRYRYWLIVGLWCVSCGRQPVVESAPSPLPDTATPRPAPVTAVPVTGTPLPATVTVIPATVTPVSATATATAFPVRTQQRYQATAVTQSAYTYVFPVADAQVNYGHDHHDYMATDIFCDDGSAFVAVIDGVVEYIEDTDLWDPATDDPAVRSGLAVAILGVDGNRYYGSHLSAIAPGLTVGMSVAAGQLLGYTGHSGNARFTPPHLHFGISRPSFPDDWQVRRGEMNPYEFLRAWEKGESLQPVFLP